MNPAQVWLQERYAKLQTEMADKLLSFVVKQAGQYLLSQTTVSVQLEQNDHLYGHLSEWLLNKNAKKPTHIDGVGTMEISGIDALMRDDEEETTTRRGDDVRINGTPAEGVYLIWHSTDDAKDVPIVLQFITQYEKNARGSIALSMRRSVRLWSYRGQLDVILSFLKSINQSYTMNAERTVSVHVSTSHGYWERLRSAPRRPIDSVVLPIGQKEALIADMKKFFADEEWYYSNAVPFRRGYLLHGVPGSGKSSLLLAIAGEFDLPLYILNLADPDLDDTRLQELFSNVGNNIAILLEDVDTLWIDRERQGKLSFSAVLNAIDGVTASQDRILFMTTNKLDVLDPALIRPGRIDYRLEFGLFTTEQARTMITRFYPELSDTIHLYAEHPKILQIVASELQKLLIDVRHDPTELLPALDAYIPVQHE